MRVNVKGVTGCILLAELYFVTAAYFADLTQATREERTRAPGASPRTMVATVPGAQGPAGAGQFAFRGRHLGDMVEDVWAGEDCNDPAVQGNSACQFVDVPITQPVELFHQLADESVSEISLRFEPTSYEALIRGFTSFNGRPRNITGETLKSVRGAPDIPNTLRWRLKDGSFFAQKFDSPIDSRVATISWPSRYAAMPVQTRPVDRGNARRSADNGRR